ncbi:MAG: SIS domain-containing protein [Methanoregula sp.]
MIPDNMDGFSEAGKMYLDFLARVQENAELYYPEIDELILMIREVQAVHVYGFGRSGAAALAFAIRLRHFSNYIPPVWWVGDQVREPVSMGDLVILFSGSGDRPEVNQVARKAKEASAFLALITAAENPALGPECEIVLTIPSLQDPRVYGGGDFELAAFFLQELLITHMGKIFDIPGEEVGLNHV